MVPWVQFDSREEWGAELDAQLAVWQPDLVVLSGSCGCSRPGVVDAWSPASSGRTGVPARIPGAHGVRDAVAAGVAQTGASVIIVDNGVDRARSSLRSAFPSFEATTSIAARPHQARRASSADRRRAPDRHRRTRPRRGPPQTSGGRRSILTSPHDLRGASMAGPSHDPALYRHRDVVPIRRALVSVSDKSDLLRLAGGARRRPGSRSSRPDRPPRRSGMPGSR